MYTYGDLYSCKHIMLFTVDIHDWLLKVAGF